METNKNCLDACRNNSVACTIFRCKGPFEPMICFAICLVDISRHRRRHSVCVCGREGGTASFLFQNR